MLSQLLSNFYRVNGVTHIRFKIDFVKGIAIKHFTQATTLNLSKLLNLYIIKIR